MLVRVKDLRVGVERLRWRSEQAEALNETLSTELSELREERGSPPVAGGRAEWRDGSSSTSAR